MRVSRQRRSLRRGVGVLALLLASISRPESGLAHAQLERADPPVGATVAQGLPN